MEDVRVKIFRVFFFPFLGLDPDPLCLVGNFGRSGQGFEGEVACLPANSAPTPWRNGGSKPRVHLHYPEHCALRRIVGWPSRWEPNPQFNATPRL